MRRTIAPRKVSEAVHHVWSETLDQVEELARPREDRGPCDQYAPLCLRKDGEEGLRSLRDSALQVVGFVSNAHFELQLLYLILLLGGKIVRDDKDGGVDVPVISARLDYLNT